MALALTNSKPNWRSRLSEMESQHRLREDSLHNAVDQINAELMKSHLRHF